MECELRIAAVLFRVRERIDHVEKLGDRARPTVGEEQRECVIVRGSHVQEMYVLNRRSSL